MGIPPQGTYRQSHWKNDFLQVPPDPILGRGEYGLKAQHWDLGDLLFLQGAPKTSSFDLNA